MNKISTSEEKPATQIQDALAELTERIGLSGVQAVLDREIAGAKIAPDIARAIYYDCHNITGTLGPPHEHIQLVCWDFADKKIRKDDPFFTEYEVTTSAARTMKEWTALCQKERELGEKFQVALESRISEKFQEKYGLEFKTFETFVGQPAYCRSEWYLGDYHMHFKFSSNSRLALGLLGSVDVDARGLAATQFALGMYAAGSRAQAASSRPAIEAAQSAALTNHSHVMRERGGRMMAEAEHGRTRVELNKAQRKLRRLEGAAPN